MTITISAGATSLNPLLMLGYNYERKSRNKVHTIVGLAAPASTLAPAGLRSGRIKLLCATLEDANTLAELHAGPDILQLADTDNPLTSMYYVLNESGTITLELDPETRTRTIVTVDFHEVTV